MNDREKKRLEVLCLHEKRYYEAGYEYICGIDEAGRGPLAGPVVAACVILPKGFILEGINDSKKIPKKKHGYYYRAITEGCLDCSVGIIGPDEIDRINILNATKKAMETAISNLNIKSDVFFIDHLALDNISTEQLSITKGDSLSLSIAAASLVAKYTRDKIMLGYSEKYPVYLFEKNAGYGTKDHIEAIKTHGICDIHRLTFVKKFI